MTTWEMSLAIGARRSSAVFSPRKITSTNRGRMDSSNTSRTGVEAIRHLQRLGLEENMRETLPTIDLCPETPRPSTRLGGAPMRVVLGSRSVGQVAEEQPHIHQTGAKALSAVWLGCRDRLPTGTMATPRTKRIIDTAEPKAVWQRSPLSKMSGHAASNDANHSGMKAPAASKTIAAA